MSSDIRNRTQGRKDMNATTVSKPLLHRPLLQFINEHTQEKSHIIVLHVGRVSGVAENLPSTRGSIVGKSHIIVLSVERPLFERMISKYTRGFTPGKSYISVLHVGRVSGVAEYLPSTRRHILEKSHINALSVVRPLVKRVI